MNKNLKAFLEGCALGLMGVAIFLVGHYLNDYLLGGGI